MRLYYHPLAFNARRAVMTAFELGAPVELVLVDLQSGEQRQSPFLRLNPNHRVPVLQDGEFLLWESHAIMQYLAELTPGQRLYPPQPQPRADVNRWLFWSAYHLSPTVRDLYFERGIKPLLGRGGPDSGIIERADLQVRELLAVLDEHLAQRQWLSGAVLTLADLAIAAPLGVGTEAELPLSECVHLRAWLERMQTLESWRRSAAA
ncbi:MAG: glutathione S-transferase family protein [Steroidobacteraceae bacterium]